MVKSSIFSLPSVKEQQILQIISGFARARIVFSERGYLMLGFLGTAKGSIIYVL